MKTAEFLEELAAVLNEDPANLTLESELESIEGWDSMGLLGVVALLDSLRDVPLDMDSLQEWQTVGDLVKLVAGKRE